MEFLLIASAHFLALLSPGPDFFLIIRTSLRFPLRYGFVLCCGIAVANGLYILMALLGIELLQKVLWIGQLMKYIGGAYLLFLGIMLLKAGRRDVDREQKGQTETSSYLLRHFGAGFLSALLNPKNGLFYLSLFTVMVSPETSFVMRCGYGLWMVSIVLVWDWAVLLVGGSKRVQKKMGRTIYLIEKLAGTMLILFGAMLPLT